MPDDPGLESLFDAGGFPGFKKLFQATMPERSDHGAIVIN